jgi:hypothetical protein
MVMDPREVSVSIMLVFPKVILTRRDSDLTMPVSEVEDLKILTLVLNDQSLPKLT